MIKKLLSLVLAAFVYSFALAQNAPPTYQDTETGNEGSRLFLGGSLNLGFATGTFNIGGVPEVGYSLSDYVDVGIGINVNYTTISGDYNYGVRVRSFNYGGGPFVRVFPFRSVFIQGQLENNWIKYSTKDESTGQSGSVTTSAPSVLLGIGYAQRIIGQSSFYTAIMIDVNNDVRSPYRDGYNRAIPIIRAGFNFYLKRHQK